MYDFTTEIDRRGTGSVKWEHISEDVTPAFVADMDFACPPEVLRALRERLDHGVFGYTADDEEGWSLQIDWWYKYHGLRFQRADAAYTAGVVAGQTAALLAVTKPGDTVAIQPPVYPHFYMAVRDNGRVLAENPLQLENGHWEMDLDHLEGIFRRGCKTLLLCAPHNPVGRVWTPEEMKALAELCMRYHVWVISDEIHGDLELFGNRHISYDSYDTRGDRTITLLSPSKTFNLAGLQQATLVCRDRNIVKSIRENIGRIGASGPNLFGSVAQKACYQYGRPWLEELIRVLEGNVTLVRDALIKKGLWCANPEGTYILWVNGSVLGKKGSELTDFLQEKTRVKVTDGTSFGGPDWFRLILATQPSRAERIAEGFRRL